MKWISCGGVMAKSFVAQLEDFADRTEDKMLRVAQASIQDVMTIAQTTVAQGGAMPVDTSFLRNSLVSSLDGSEVAKGDGKTNSSGDAVVTLSIAQLQIGQTIRFAWVAEYALRLHYGFNDTDSLGRTYSQGGNLWRDLAAAQWQDIVTKNAKAVT